MNIYMKDGEPMKYGDVAFDVEASVHTILNAKDWYLIPCSG